MKFKFYISLVIYLLFFINANEIDTLSNTIKYPGAKALQFSMDGLLKMGSFNGSGFSMKSFQNNSKARRLGIFYYGSYDWKERNRLDINEYSYNDSTSLDTNYYDVGYDYTYTRIEIKYQFIRYEKPYKDVSLFYGFGPMFGISIRNKSDELTDQNQIKITRDDKDSYYGGISSVVGVEWFINDNISLHSEYTGSIIYEKYDDDRLWDYEFIYGGYSRDSDELSGTTLSISSRVMSGVSVYFR